MGRTLSIYLDLVRFVAALVVFVSHANYTRLTGGLPGLWRLSGLGNDSVMMFFVLSGFVIAHVAATKERTLTDYATSRFARLYSVAVPALVLTVIADGLGATIAPDVYAGDRIHDSMPGLRLQATLLFTNELWFTSIRPFSNVPFWSLGYEAWYYVLFGAAFYLEGRARVVCVTATAMLIGPKILLLLPLWLLGTWTYRQVCARSVVPRFGWTLFVGSIVAYVACRQADVPEHLFDLSAALLGRDFLVQDLRWSQQFLWDYGVGALIAANFIGAAAIAPHVAGLAKRVEQPIRTAAGYTFALYLFHYPLLHFVAACAKGLELELWRPVFVVCTSLALVVAVGGWAEGTKGWWKRQALRVVGAGRVPAA